MRKTVTFRSTLDGFDKSDGRRASNEEKKPAETVAVQ